MFAKPLIALDIGSSAIKLAGLSGGGRDRKVAWLGVETVPPGAIENGNIRDPGRVLETVARLCRQAGVNPRQSACAIALGGPHVVVKKAWIDVPTHLDAHTEIYYEASQLFQIDIAELHFRYQALPGEAPGGERPGRPYLLVGARRQAVDERVALLRQIGLKTAVVDCDVFCLSNVFGHMALAPMTVALVNVGAQHTQVLLQHGGTFLNGCELAMGGFTHTKRVMDALRCDAATAESLKIAACLGSDRVPAEVHHAIDDVNEELAQAVATAVTFLAHSPHEPLRSPQHVILTGGGARTLGLDVSIGARLRLPFSLAHPFMGADWRVKGKAGALAAAQGPLFSKVMGLALRRARDEEAGR